MALKKICAWCNKDLGIIECNKTGISHGLCRACQIKFDDPENWDYDLDKKEWRRRSKNE